MLSIPLREELAKAGKKYDGHVTHGSLSEQEKLVNTLLKEQREADKRAICYMCREPDNPIRRLQYGVYMHTKGGQGPCLAGPIWALEDRGQ